MVRKVIRKDIHHKDTESTEVAQSSEDAQSSRAATDTAKGFDTIIGFGVKKTFAARILLEKQEVGGFVTQRITTWRVVYRTCCRIGPTSRSEALRKSDNFVRALNSLRTPNRSQIR